MKMLALTLLIPVALCTACAQKDDPPATNAPATVDQPANVPAPATTVGNMPASVDATANEPPPVNTNATSPDGTAAPVGTAASTAAATAGAPTTSRVSLISAAGSSVKGELTLTNEGTAVSVKGEITGLEPGKEHGFHVHAMGQCSLPDFQSAGDHFNPTNDPHGGPKSNARHLGDMPNAKADKDGRATIDTTIKLVTLGDKDGAPADFLGKALVVHAMPDDYKTQPSGGSGNRIACGVIR